MAPPHYCLFPENPDITGIGVRTSIYAQSILTGEFRPRHMMKTTVTLTLNCSPVILSLLARRRGKPSGSVAAIWRVQFYTLMAFIIATIVLRTMGGLGLFHEMAAIHLGILIIWSAHVGILCEVIKKDGGQRDVGDGFVLDGGTIWIDNYPYSRTIYLVTQFGLLVVYVLMFVIMLSERCVASPDNPNSGYAQLVWIFHFGIRLTGSPHPKLAGSISSIALGLPFFPIFYMMIAGILDAVFMYMKTKRTSKTIRVRAVVIAFAVFWIQEVISIELSLQANPGLDSRVENSWQFGQVCHNISIIRRIHCERVYRLFLWCF
jgi:hypothetical protein